MLSIGSFSKVANIPTKTLRYYDEIGLLKPGYVDSDTGYRFYDVAQLETVLLIGRLKSYDFSLDEIAQILKKPKDNATLLPAILQKKARIERMLSGYANVLEQINGDINNLERGNYFMSYLDDITVDLTQTESMNILSVREKINVKEYGKYMGGLFKRIQAEKLTIVAPPMSIFHDEEFNPEHYDMEIAVPVKEAADGMREFPAFLCAHATLKGNYNGLTSVYAKIREWMEAEGYVIAAPAFEAYVTDPSQVPPGENITEVYCPVKKG